MDREAHSRTCAATFAAACFLTFAEALARDVSGWPWTICPECGGESAEQAHAKKDGKPCPCVGLERRVHVRETDEAVPAAAWPPK